MTNYSELVVANLDASPRRLLNLLLVEQHVDGSPSGSSLSETRPTLVDTRLLLRSIKLQNDGKVTHVDTALSTPQAYKLMRAIRWMLVRGVGPENINPGLNEKPGCDHCGGELKPVATSKTMGYCSKEDCDIKGKPQDIW